MVGGHATRDFYANLGLIAQFENLSDTGCFSDLPDDWLVGVSDVIDSTGEISRGRYKTVNMVGAAVISAQINTIGPSPFPFVFGGDGAAFAIWPDQAKASEAALRAVQRWAEDEFDIKLRAGLVPLRDIRAAGLQIGVARYRASDGADYAMFNGGGVAWAEAELKQGRYGLSPAPSGTHPDLTGLSCRWSPTRSRNGVILSLVILPVEDTPAAQFYEVAGTIVRLAQRLERGGHPVPADGPGTQWPPPGVELEAHAIRGAGTLGRCRRTILFETLIAWILLRTGWTIGGFNARRYARVTGENSDYRKYDDGLKMTLDCDAATLAQIETALNKAQKDGVVRYGLLQQDEAMMTCIVPSILTDNHIHFIDGASGGYTRAAEMIKAGRANPAQP